MSGSASRLPFRVHAGRLYLAALFATTLAYGSTSPGAHALSSLVIAAAAAPTLLLLCNRASTSRIRVLALLLLIILLIDAVAQTFPGLAHGLALSAWQLAPRESGFASNTISVAPGETLEAIPALISPFLVFVGGLSLFQDDDETARLWKALATFGAACALLGLLQQAFLPDQLLFVTKKYYLGDVTGPFVNRNTAGTFFGLALLLNMGLFFQHLRSTKLASIAERFSIPEVRWWKKYGDLIFRLACCLVCGIALFLTESRGAVGASLCAAMLAVALFASRRLTADRSSVRHTRLSRFVRVSAGVFIVAGLFMAFAGRTGYRMQEQGTDDARWCVFSSIFSALRDNWLLGTGYGAFQDVFPIYRAPDCAGIFGVYDRAHDFFLEGMLGLGLPFAVVCAVGSATLFIILVRGVRRRRAQRFIPVAGLAALVLTALHALVDFSLQIPGFNVYFAAAMAAAVSASLGGAVRLENRTPYAAPAPLEPADVSPDVGVK